MRWLIVFLLACLLFNGLQGWLRRIGLGKLPGDFSVRIRGRDWYFPLTSSVVLAVLMMLIGALYPIGSIAQGALADEIGLRATTTGAAVLLGGLLLAWRILRPRASHAIGDTITTAATTGGLDAVVSPAASPVADPAAARHLPNV